MILDIDTLFIVTFLLAAMVSVALLLLWRLNKDITALCYWAAGCFFWATGAAFSVLRGPNRIILELLLSNVLTCAGAVFLWIGTRSFFGRPIPARLAAMLLSMEFVLLLIFTVIVPNHLMRIIALMLFLTGMWIWCALDLLRISHWRIRTLNGVLGYVFLVNAGFNLMRAAITVSSGPLFYAAATSSLIGFTFLGGAMAILGLGIGFILMTTERLQDELQQAATHDALTGVLNRRAFRAQAERAFASARRSGKPFSLLLLDLDHFKRINDTFGHQAGDEALCAFAELAQQVLRQGDLFGRYGGEEFCALLPDTNRDDAWAVAERLRIELSNLETQHQGHRLLITVSIGVVEGPVGADSLDAIIAEADKLLYCAKALGRNRVEIHREPAKA